MNNALARPFHTLLVANRGEIACRVMRTARQMGLRTVAVYSEADAHAPHVQMADRALCIGPAPAAQSYLRIDRIIDAAAHTDADAVHPGYGFLSERAEFAEACTTHGLVWVGPSATAIAAMGDKAAAKARMQRVGVPCVPGWHALPADLADDATLLQEATRIGVPLLVKAVAGGGGRGMRLVQHLSDLPEALTAARREAEQAFGDGTLMLERWVADARHIEVQVFADHQGRTVHLGERDCTAQRRRQKVIEESPSPTVGTALRERLVADALAAARAVSYVNAGTVEFIVDREGQHYFLEMNTRLQVEHPVTEAVTGLDLVAWQLRVAMGEPLPLAQADISFTGHAMQARLYAEDPTQGFLPQTGRVRHWRPEASVLDQPGARIDSGVNEGDEVTPHYDPMVAKLIVHGRDRTDARRQLSALLARTPLMGLQHNAHFLRQLIDEPAFARATMHTRLLDDWAADRHAALQTADAPDTAWCLAAAVLCGGGLRSPRAASVASFDLLLQAQGMSAQHGPPRSLRVEPQAQGCEVRLDKQVLRLQWLQPFDATVHVADCLINGVRHRHTVVLEADAQGDPSASTVHIADGAAVHRLREVSPRASAVTRPAGEAVAPMAGSIVAVAVQVGQRVQAGDPLICIEAMKMEMWQRAALTGTVAAVGVQVGDRVAAGTLLARIQTDQP